MVLDLTVMSITPFLTVTSLLVIYSVLDIRDRRVKNEYSALGLVGGAFVIGLLTGTWRLMDNIVLHVAGILLALPISYILFKIGSIGGADAKVLSIIACLSPGIELGSWNQPILEAIIGLGVELIVMLLGGYFYWRYKRTSENATPPLIPLLLLGYLAIQLIALI
jgi:Flp pilus assembly protein protease CpaA